MQNLSNKVRFLLLFLSDSVAIPPVNLPENAVPFVIAKRTNYFVFLSIILSEPGVWSLISYASGRKKEALCRYFFIIIGIIG